MTATNYTLVPPHGPKDAPILWVGEAPGRQEVVQRRPFVGPSGQLARRTLKWAGIDPDREVRFANVCMHNPGPFPPGARGAKLLKRYAAQLDETIESMPNLKVIVACGGPALTRLTGRRSLNGNGWGIGDWRGSVFHNHHLDDVFTWSRDIKHPALLPYGVKIIPTVHPASILRSKGRDDVILLRRDIAKVKAAIDGRLKRITYNFIQYPPLTALEEAANNARVVYFDTEYHRETKKVHWVGLTFDGATIYGFPFRHEYVDFMVDLLTKAKFTESTIDAEPFAAHLKNYAPANQLLKAAHNIHADMAALESSCGVHITGPLYDTMLGMHALHPSLEVGLDDTALFYLDDVVNWKDMPHDDPQYNALDVAYGWHCMLAQWNEAAERPVPIADEIRSRMILAETTYMMTKRGMPVNTTTQKHLREESQKRIAELNEEIQRAVHQYWDTRYRAALEDAQTAQVEYDTIRTKHLSKCSRHPTYNGLRQPAKSCTTCIDTFRLNRDDRELYPHVKKERLRTRKEVDRLSGGFQPTNNEHLRWLLYDPYALRLPIQKNFKTRQVTADRSAIDKLATLRTVQRQGDAFKLILKIKEVQHLEKAIATFLNIPLDENDTAHPPYKIHGTRTGRLAGGRDTDYKSDNRYAFNALNIPREWRRMFVAPPGQIIVAADWSNVEGRLTAFFSKDRRYQAALDGEMQGGPKVHAINAAIIYSIDPSDAKTHLVTLGGVERTAYDGGKRLTHAWSYGMQLMAMCRNFNIEMHEAEAINEKLSNAYPQLVNWRNELVTRVLGQWEKTGDGGEICVQQGQRLLANPFGWQFRFMGHGLAQANEVIAFLPQSTGQSMWSRCVPLLEERFPVMTGTYDSAYLFVPNSQVLAATDALEEIMGRAWPELGGRKFPIEIESGMNMGPRSADNPQGLRHVA